MGDLGDKPCRTRSGPELCTGYYDEETVRHWPINYHIVTHRRRFPSIVAALGAPELGFVLWESRCDNTWELATGLLDADVEVACGLPTAQDLCSVSTK
jgi:hypothetical protein